MTTGQIALISLAVLIGFGMLLTGLVISESVKSAIQVSCIEAGKQWTVEGECLK